MATTKNLGGDQVIIWQDGLGAALPEQAIVFDLESMTDCEKVIRLDQGNDCILINEDVVPELIKLLRKAIKK